MLKCQFIMLNISLLKQTPKFDSIWFLQKYYEEYFR